MRIATILILAGIFLLNPAVFGQKEFKKADKLLQLKAFDLAIKNYEEGLKKHPEDARGHAQLAEAYRMQNRLLESIKAYDKALSIDPNIDNEYKLNYAKTLKKVGLYDRAETWFAEYMPVSPELAAHHLMSLDYAKVLLQDQDRYDVISFDGNSPESDFGVSFFKDKIVFASFRKDLSRKSDKKNESYINIPGNQLFTAPIDGLINKNNIEFLRPDEKEIYNVGPLSYTKDGSSVAFMKNSFHNGTNQIFGDETELSIYIAKTDMRGDFMEIVPFPYNQVDFSYAFPHLSFNGKAMYFSSNRPGGFGGFDIYVSYLKDDNWSVPQNLGENVNTSGNEITPYFDGEELYFSSDYHKGLGGFDCFVSKVVEGQWALAENLGKGINSPADDYYLVPDKRPGNYYFTSNRLGGRGKDDIYIAYQLMEDVPAEEPLAIDLEQLTRDQRDLANMENAEATKDDPSVSEVVQVGDEEMIRFLKVDEGSVAFDYEGAKLLNAAGEDEKIEVYFIQLASLTQSEGKLGYFDKVVEYGNLYRFFKPNSVKIRLGYYKTKDEAGDYLNKVKGAGFKDAFVIADVLGVSQFELLKSGAEGTNSEFWINEYSSAGSQYKVKLAAYQNPLYFNIDGIDDLGKIEQWSKGSWTIFVLSGFDSMESAQKARIKAINRGYADAELVVDDGGILKKVRAR
jgi:hypothetical protein